MSKNRKKENEQTQGDFNLFSKEETLCSARGQNFKNEIKSFLMKSL